MDYIISTFLILLSVIIGLAILNKSQLNINIKEFKLLNFGMAFFIGIIFIIVNIRFFSFITGNALFSLFLVSFFSLVLIYFSRQHLINVIKNNILVKSYLIFIISFLLFFLLILIYWLQGSDSTNPFESVGSLHSVRYVNVAEFILKNNYIPIIGQNTGQSIITYIILAIGAKSGYVALTIFLVSSIIFLSLIIYELFHIYLKNKKHSFFATFIFFTANTGLSISHILIIDSGSPFFLNGYTDTILGMFIMFMLFIVYSTISKLDKPNFYQCILILLLLIGTFYVAPQNILLILATFSILIILRFSIKHKYLLGLLISISLIVSIPQGGMLTPSSLQHNVNIPGIMKVESSASPTVKVRPGVMFFLQSKDTFDSSNYFDRHNKTKFFFDKHDYKTSLFYIEETLVISIRVLFFPLVGFLLLFLYTDKMKGKNFFERDFFNINLLKTCGLIIFIIGFFVAFSFEIHGKKWETTRFMIPGIMFGMFSFILSIFLFLKNNSKYMNLKIMLILFIMSFGPISNFLLTIEKRIVENKNSMLLDNSYNTFSNQITIDLPVMDN